MFFDRLPLNYKYLFVLVCASYPSAFENILMFQPQIEYKSCAYLYYT